MILLSMGLNFSCKKEDKKELLIYNWSYYIPDEVIKEFEKEYNLKIIYDSFASNEEMYEVIKSGKNYDIIFPSGDFVTKIIEDDTAVELDKSKIPNLKNIDERILNKIGFDPGNKYSVPYIIGAAGIAVNTKYVKNYPKDYSIFALKEYKGKMLMLEDMREVIGAGLAHFGYSVNSTNDTELDQVEKLLLNWRQNIKTYDAENFALEFANENIWITQCYVENIFLEADESLKEYIDFFIPENGGAMYIDNMMIMKDSKNKEMAYKFINFIHEPQRYAEIVDWLYLPSLNETARKYTKNDKKYTIEDLNNCEFINNIDNDIQKYTKIWNKLLTNKME